MSDNNDNDDSAQTGLYVLIGRIRFDSAVWLASLATAAMLLLYISPLLSPLDLEYFAEYVGAPIAIGVALFALFHGLSRIPHSGERRFWLLIAAALACWLAGRLVYFFHLSEPRAEYLYLAYYIAIIIAIDQRPHLKPGWAVNSPRSVFATAGTLVLTAGLLSYFVLVPSIWTPQSGAVLNQHYVYLFLDAIVALRFFRHFKSCRSQRWSNLYALLAVTGALILAEDVRDFLFYAKILPVAAGGWLDVLYYLPHVTLIAATRLRNSTASKQLDPTEDWPEYPQVRRGIPGLLWGCALLLPTMHLSLSYLGLLDHAYRTQLDLAVLFFSLVLTTLAIIQLRFAERKKIYLASQLAVLRSSETALRADKASALRRFSGGIAHRFNNLLQIIIGYGQMLLRRPETDWQQRTPISRMLEASAAASSLTEQLLAISRTMVLRPRLLEINALLEDRHHRLQRTVGTDILIRMAMDPDRIWMVADSEAIFHAFRRIAVFASGRMPPGTELTLATRSIRLGSQSVRSRCLLDPGRYAVVSLGCSGWTLANKERQQLFEPFALDAGPDGLALATAQAIIDQSGGHISASTEPGQGINFEIFFPLADPPSAAAAEPSAQLPATGTTLRCVLLVDDDDELRVMLHDYLSGAGLHVLMAGNGQQALEICHRHHAAIDLLLTDVVMPEMGGFALARQVSERYPDIQILFMSGHLEADSLQLAEGDWRARYLAKPFGLEELRKKLLELFAPY